MRSQPLARTLLVLLLASTLALAGCTQETSEDGPGTGDQDPGDRPPESTADCDRAVVPGDQDGQEGHVLVLSCQGQGPGQQNAQLACPQPDGAELHAGTDLTDGQITVAVDDAGGTEIANETLADTDTERRNIPLETDQAQPGDWTVRVHRSAAYDGEHRVELWCPTG